MTARFPSSRDSRSALFEGYSGGPSAERYNNSPSPRPASGGYGYTANAYGGSNGTYGGANGMNGNGSLGLGQSQGGYRPATPNRRGQYSDAVLNELESQNDGEVEGIMGKVRQLKSMTIAIGDEIRDSSALAEKMNDTFDSTTLKLRGTMNRMLVMAQKTGVGWKVWLAFFAALGFLFFYVWVF